MVPQIIFLLLQFLALSSATNWQTSGNVKWAQNCDYRNNDIGNQQSRGEDCGGLCTNRNGCTHFSWSNYNGGTCWMKGGDGDWASAAYAGNNGGVCGYLSGGGGGGGSRKITFTNKCGKDIWISPLTNAQGPALNDGVVKVSNSGSHTYEIPDNGWGGRFWPKLGCDGSGQNCKVGQSNPPCPQGGCQPPADTKVEFFFPEKGSQNAVWYDVSLVDGYSLPAEIVPSQQGGSCVPTHCTMSLSSCPTGERDVGDLRVWIDGSLSMCLSPCKKWNWPSPIGMGRSEQDDPGKHLCCPTPPVSSEECRRGPVVSTQYVNLIHQQCPSAYSYAYDDEGGLHNCPSDTNFSVTFCP